MKKDKEWLKQAIKDSGLICSAKLYDLIDQLDEPEKPVIPQFVADWIKKWKREELILRDWSRFNLDDENEYEVAEWLYDNDDDEINILRKFTLIDAIRYGYEVEKEKLYIIKFAPSIYGTPTYGSIGVQNGKKIMQSVYGSQEGIIPNQYTRREIEEVGSEYMIFAEEVTE